MEAGKRISPLKGSNISILAFEYFAGIVMLLLRAIALAAFVHACNTVNLAASCSVVCCVLDAIYRNGILHPPAVLV